MADEPTGDTGTAVEESTGIDMDAASDLIGASLFPETAEEREATPVEQADDTIAQTKETPAPVTQPELPGAPKSWPKEMHGHWGKVPKEVQDYLVNVREKQMLDGLEQYKSAATYGKTMQEAVQPFEHILREQGLDVPRAVNALLGAQQRLTTGTLESRQAAYAELGKRLNLAPSSQVAGAESLPVDPRIQGLEERQQQIEQYYRQQEETRYKENLSKISSEVDAFSKDPAHPHFDECIDDISMLIKAGLPLQEAYERAVWANPVVREKQVQARLLTETEKARERARLDALPKGKAKSVNVNSRDTSRTPTEALGTMEDTAKKTLVSIRSRTAH